MTEIVSEHEARYVVGLDIGDGESALCWVPTGPGHFRDKARIFERASQERSVITATALESRGEGEPNRFVIGEEAFLSRDCSHFNVNFKTATDPNDPVTPQAVLFAQVLLGEFFAAHPDEHRHCAVYVGHPAGWPRHADDVSRKHFGTLQVPVHLMSESQSALVHVRDRRVADPAATAQDADLRNVLIVDVGSSTTDFTFVSDLTPRNLPVGMSLGCRRIDEELARRVQAACGDDSEFKAALAAPGGKEMLRVVCRRAKEAQFTRDSAAETNFLRMHAGCDGTFTPIIEKGFGWLRGVEIPEDVVAAPGGWADDFRAVLAEAKQHLGETQPQLIITTGGGSRMPVVRAACAEAFPEAILENDPKPAFTVARGLASAGRHRVGVERFRQDIRALKDQPVFTEHIKDALLTAFDHVTSALRQRFEQEVTESAKTVDLLDDLIHETAGLDDVFRRLRVSLEASLTPVVLEICRSYGVRDDQFPIDFTLPDIVGTTMKARIRTAWRTMGMSQQVLSAAAGVEDFGTILLQAARTIYSMKGLGPLLATAAAVGGAGVTVIGAAQGVDYLARRRLQSVLETAELESAEVTRMVEEVAESITVQMDARAVEIDRFVL